MAKTIFIFNDGTGQHLGSKAATNVAKLFNALPGNPRYALHADGFKEDPVTKNVAIYIRGIGTEDVRAAGNLSELNVFKRLFNYLNTKFYETLEQVSGDAIVTRIKHSFGLFESVYEEGDEIVLVGFSRGAASIRILASELIKRRKVKIKYMLVFDTVYSVMGPVKILDGESIERFKDFDIHPDILKCDHLIAGDEMRDKFPFSPVNPRAGVRQILFPGTHSDVGGGHDEKGLSDISLLFAMQEFENLGLNFSPERVVALKLAPNVEANATFVVVGGVGQKHFPRPLKDMKFSVHRSVIDRAKAIGSPAIALMQLCNLHGDLSKSVLEVDEIDASFDLLIERTSTVSSPC